jgi:hypothetical protein
MKRYHCNRVLLQTLTAQKLATAIHTAIEPQRVLKAISLGEEIQAEDTPDLVITVAQKL